MRLEIRMPRLSEYSDVGVVAKWRVKVGDVVQKGDVVAEADVDLSRTKILAAADGKIVEIWVHAGETVPVETVIAMMKVDDAALVQQPAVDEPQPETAAAAPDAGSEDVFDAFAGLEDETDPYADPGGESEAGSTEAAGARYGNVMASADAIQLAVQHNINLETLIGTGSCGQIERADVEAAMHANSPFITPEDVDELMNFDGDFASTLPSDTPAPAPAPAPEAEPEAEPEAASEPEPPVAGQGDAAVEAGAAESSSADIDVSTEEPHPPEDTDAETAAAPEASSNVIYMGAGPEFAAEPEALAIDESDTISPDDEPQVESADEEEFRVEAAADEEFQVESAEEEEFQVEAAEEEEPAADSEPTELDAATVEQVISQVVKESARKSVKVRRLVSRKMEQSWQHAPHFFVTVAVDMTDVIRFRTDLGVTINDFILAATTRALKEHPWVNSHFIDDEAVEQADINISMAVETEQGLYYPVLKNCAGKSVKEIGLTSAAMVVKAHSGKLTDEDLEGGSFTISNMGMLGVESFSAIITPPQVAVLAVGTVRGEVIIDEYEEMAMAPMVRLTLSGDHRALDGADAADFLGTMKSYLEAPITLVAPQEVD